MVTAWKLLGDIENGYMVLKLAFLHGISLHFPDCVFVPIGRRVAELELHIALAHFMRNF